MSTTINQDGYIAKIEISEDYGGSFFGRIINIKDTITFYGKSLEELKKEMRAQLDFYFEVCEKRGEKPQKPYSGRFNLRLEPDLHANLVERATRQDKSLNQYIVGLLQNPADNNSAA